MVASTTTSSAPVEAERKMQRARISAKEGRVSRNTRLSLDSETGLEREETEKKADELPDVDPDDVVPHGTRYQTYRCTS